MNQNTIVVACGHEADAQASDWATRSDGQRICNDCADQEMLAHIAKGEPCLFYISADHRQLTSWTGGFMMTVTRARIGGHGFARQLYVTAIDTWGHTWTGRGSADNGTYVRVRRTKAARRPIR